MDTKTMAENHGSIAIMTLSIVILAALVLFAVTGTYASQTNSLASAQDYTRNSSKVLLSSTQYAQHAYQAYSGPLSRQARAAFSGFNLTYAALQNSSVAITVPP